MKLSLEEMYDSLAGEIEHLHELMLQANSDNEAEAKRANYELGLLTYQDKSLQVDDEEAEARGIKKRKYGEKDSLTLKGIDLFKYVDMKTPSVI